MDKMSAYFLEIINKAITVGVTDDLFSEREKAQIIDDYSEWINKNNDEMATGYVICTCYVCNSAIFLPLPLSLPRTQALCWTPINRPYYRVNMCACEWERARDRNTQWK